MMPFGRWATVDVDADIGLRLQFICVWFLVELLLNRKPSSFVPNETHARQHQFIIKIISPYIYEAKSVIHFDVDLSKHK